MTLLSVNINKIAVLRNSRGGTEPSVTDAASLCIEQGCGGITVHPRPDGRHIRTHDVYALAQLCKNRVEYNIEGNPFAAANEQYPGLLELVRRTNPNQVTLVPDADGQITSDHGFDLHKDATRLKPLIQQLHDCGARVSLFIDPAIANLAIAKEIGADRIEIYTGPYAEAYGSDNQQAALNDCVITANAAIAADLGVNAGHDLCQANLELFLSTVQEVAEVSIGHAIISEAIYDGLALTIQRYLDIIRKAK